MDTRLVDNPDLFSNNSSVQTNASAYAELEKIIADIETDISSENVHTAKVKRAFELIKVCKKNYHCDDNVTTRDAEHIADKVEFDLAIQKADESEQHVRSLVSN